MKRHAFAERTSTRSTADGPRSIHIETSHASGGGAGVIAIHGGPGFTIESLRDGMAALAAHVPVAMFDLPGCGRSSRHPGSGYRLDAYLDDLAAVIDAVGAQRVVLLAHGWGAILATRAAMRHDPRIAGLVLVNPLRILNESGQDTDAQHRRIDAVDPTLIPRFRAMAELFDRARAGDAAAWDAIDRAAWPREMFATQFAGPVPAAWRERMREAALGYESYHAYKGRALYDETSDWARFDLADWARQVDLPVLVVGSDDDANYVAPIACHARPLVDAFRRGRLEVLSGVGHFPFAERPGPWAAQVADWIGASVPTVGAPAPA